MNLDIQYAGFTTTPDDYSCPDGQLAAAINCVPEDGALKPVSAPPLVEKIPSGYGSVVFIHKTLEFTHYIAYDSESGALTWFSPTIKGELEGEEEVVMLPNEIEGEVKSLLIKPRFAAMGNTMIVSADSGLHYFLWESNDLSYSYLGNQLPEISLRFGLQAQNWQATPETNLSADIVKDANALNGHIHAQVAKFLAENVTAKGFFLFPFVVRYAIRLFDGSLTMHSAPIVMQCANGPVPFVFWTKGSNGSLTMSVESAVFALKIEAAAGVCDTLEKWSDIIKSVDIFISRPVYTYDPNKNLDSSTEDNKSISDRLAETLVWCSTLENIAYGYHNFSDFYSGTLPAQEAPSGLVFTPRVPGVEWKDVDKQLKSCSEFHLLQSLTPSSFINKRNTDIVKQDFLHTLAVQETLPDDFDSHSKLVSEWMHVYNGRLHLCSLSKYRFPGFPPEDFVPLGLGEIVESTLTVIFAEGERKWRISRPCGAIEEDIENRFFYPSTAAKEIWFSFDYYRQQEPNHEGNERVYCRKKYKLKPHDFLNGMVVDKLIETNESLTPFTEEDIPVPLSPIKDRVYVSEVNNPFVFPASSVVSVGSAKIMAVSSAARPLSTGQFGQFPLYAFTDEGVWALEIGTTGTYTARQPITRDVCISPAGIAQLDSSVVFPTPRGLMQLSGSQASCITDPIGSDYPFDVSSLPAFGKLHGMMHTNPDTCLPTVPFREFMKECRIVYDYIRQRLIVFSNLSYAYVFSLKSGMWGMMYSSLSEPLNSYPLALVRDLNGNIVSLSDRANELTRMLWVTRPLKLGQGSLLKTIDTIIHRGNFDRGDVSTVLYGSRDLINWHLVWSSKDHYLRGFRGTPYKFFRIAGIGCLDESENVIGASVQFTPRLTNQPR